MGIAPSQSQQQFSGKFACHSVRKLRENGTRILKLVKCNFSVV